LQDESITILRSLFYNRCYLIYHPVSPTMSSAQLPRYHPDQPEDPIPPYAAIPDEGALDQAVPDELLPAGATAGAASNDSPPARQSSTLQLPRLVLGCATFGDGIFAASDAVRSDMPARVVRLALRSGMTAFDTGACAGFLM
jgi:hypothetical protein